MAALGEYVLPAFLLFCRIGGCLMLMPGFSSPRIPVQVRLFVAIAIALSISPFLVPDFPAEVKDPPPGLLARLIVTETAIGATIGLMGRFFFLALQFMATAITMYLGLSALPEQPIEENEPAPALANLITLTATVLFFLTEQHWEVIKALVASYGVLPPLGGFSAQESLNDLTRTLALAFLLSLQISSPFIAYAIIVNFLFGLANKLTPQIPVYFISMPFVVAGGMLMLLALIGEALQLFTAVFADWLRQGG
jgi:flagellar biosynthetic protein FliR